MKLNQKIWHIEINNAILEKSYRPNGVKIEELKIIGISKYKICLNNDWFTTMDIAKDGLRKDHSMYTYFDNIKTSIRTQNSILGDGVFISLYSTKEPTKKLLEKMVASASNKIDKEFGFLFSRSKDELYNLINKYNLK